MQENKKRLVENDLCSQNLATNLNEAVPTEKKNCLRKSSEHSIVFQRNPLTATFDLNNKDHVLWSPDFSFVEHVVAELQYYS